MHATKAGELELPNGVCAVTRRAACSDGDGGVDVLLTPPVIAALVPGSAAVLPKEVLHSAKVRLTKQGTVESFVFYETNARKPGDSDRWMHGALFVNWLSGARSLKAAGNERARAAAELVVAAVESLMKRGVGEAAPPAVAAGPATATAKAKAKAAPKPKAKAKPPSQSQPRRGAAAHKHAALGASAMPTDGSIPRFAAEVPSRPPPPTAAETRTATQSCWARLSDAEFAFEMASAMETARGSRRLPRGSYLVSFGVGA